MAAAGCRWLVETYPVCRSGAAAVYNTMTASPAFDRRLLTAARPHTLPGLPEQIEGTDRGISDGAAAMNLGGSCIAAPITESGNRYAVRQMTATLPVAAAACRVQAVCIAGMKVGEQSDRAAAAPNCWNPDPDLDSADYTSRTSWKVSPARAGCAAVIYFALI